MPSIVNCVNLISVVGTVYRLSSILGSDGFLEKHPGPVRFANIDCDLYSSTRDIFALLADRIVPGTVLVFDEYLFNDGWQKDEYKAFQELVEQHGLGYEYLGFSLFEGQAAVKITDKRPPGLLDRTVRRLLRVAERLSAVRSQYAEDASPGFDPPQPDGKGYGGYPVWNMYGGIGWDSRISVRVTDKYAQFAGASSAGQFRLQSFRELEHVLFLNQVFFEADVGDSGDELAPYLHKLFKKVQNDDVNTFKFEKGATEATSR